MRLLALSSILALVSGICAESGAGGLYPPGLLPLINRANALLSVGQFNEASKIYSEAIEQSPTDYLLYYKRATAHLSLSRHAAALDDFEKVLSLTSNTFDNAHLMKARIHAKEGDFVLARGSLVTFLKSKPGDKAGTELMAEIEEAEQMSAKAEKERKAQLWNACVESTSVALRTATHSVEIRQLRAECALAAGDIDSGVGDLTRLTHLLPPSTSLMTLISRLSYFLLPPSPGAMNTLKQCLHFDPDSKPCLVLHRIFKGLDRSFLQLEQLQEKEDWKGVLSLLEGKGRTNELVARYDEALESHVPPEILLAPPSTSSSAKKNKPSPAIPLPDATRASPLRQTLIRAMCKAHTQLGDHLKAEKWCEQLLGMEGCGQDIDGLVGRGEAFGAKAEWEESVRVLGEAFEASGRSNRDIHQRLQRAQKRLKQSKQKDYYKVLGVSRDADTRTIKKAFHKAAKTAHPDKGGSESKMATVNEAYEVLSNPELRQRFDNGDDPNDPMGQQGPFASGQHPFAQFFQQGGGFPGGGFGGSHHGGGGFQFHYGH